jgi:dTDP-L-rhamnose 4-epimerase
MGKKILVTGGAGFIGSHLVDALIARGHQVRVLDALVPQVHASDKPEFLNPKAEFIRADICDREALQRALDGVSVVFHDAAEVGVGQSMYEMERYVRANTLGTSILLEEIVARKGTIQKVVVASSMSVYGEGAYTCPKCGPKSPKLRSSEQLAKHDWELHCETCGADLKAAPTSEEKPIFPTSVYAISKQDQEQLCLVVGRSYGVPTVALRYFNVYGDRQALSNPYTGICAIFSSRLLNDQPPLIFEDGEQTRDFVHVSDIVQGNLRAMESDRADYEMLNIGTGMPTSVNQVARMLSDGLGKQVPAQVVGKFREGDIRHCVADISKARKLIGYEPAVQLQKGIPELLAWVKVQRASDRTAKATQELESRNLVR